MKNPFLLRGVEKYILLPVNNYGSLPVCVGIYIVVCKLLVNPRVYKSWVLLVSNMVAAGFSLRL